MAKITGCLALLSLHFPVKSVIPNGHSMNIYQLTGCIKGLSKPKLSVPISLCQLSEPCPGCLGFPQREASMRTQPDSLPLTAYLFHLPRGTLHASMVPSETEISHQEIFIFRGSNFININLHHYQKKTLGGGHSVS